MNVLIIKRGLYRNTHPHTAGQFQHSAKHDAYIYQGREFSAEDFNALATSKEWIRLIERNGSSIIVMVVEEIQTPPVTVTQVTNVTPPIVTDENIKPEISTTTTYPVFAGPQKAAKAKKPAQQPKKIGRPRKSYK